MTYKEKRKGIGGRKQITILTKEQEKEIVRRYNNGEVFFDLAKEYKKGATWVKNLLLRSGVKIRTCSENKRKYSFNTDFFKKIDTEEKAYFLGFMYADGNVCKSVMQVCLHQKDEEILVKMKKAMESNHPISTYKHFKRLQIGYRPMVEDLKVAGCVPRKTTILKFPHKEIVPNHLIHHFIRGYFDGDGCITYSWCKGQAIWGWSLLSTNHICEGIKSIMENLKIVDNLKIRPYKCIFDLRISKNKPDWLKKIFDFLYSDATVFLTRKKEKFKEIFKIKNFQFE